MVTKPLGDIIRVKSGDGIAVAHLHEYDKYPVYGGNGINGYTSEYNVDANTMIIGRVGEKCGNINISISKSWVSDNALIVTPKIAYDNEYLRYLLEQINLNDYANRNAQPVISGKTIYKIDVPYITDTVEQYFIGQQLRAFDDHITNLTELIEKKKGIRDGALEDLVSGRARLKDVDIVWEETELGRIASYRKGRTLSQRKHYISTENMRQEFAGITPYSGSYIVDGCEFSEGDTLMANIRPYLKKIWYANFSGCCSADVLVVHCNEGIVPKYLYYAIFLKTPKSPNSISSLHQNLEYNKAKKQPGLRYTFATSVIQGFIYCAGPIMTRHPAGSIQVFLVNLIVDCFYNFIVVNIGNTFSPPCKFVRMRELSDL